MSQYYRAQITRECFHLVPAQAPQATLCGEQLAGRLCHVTSRVLCRKCRDAYQAANNITTPRVRVKPVSETALKKCSGAEGPIEAIMPQDGQWWLGIDTGTRRKGGVRKRLAADECLWTDDEVEPVNCDRKQLVWYGRVIEALHRSPRYPGT